MFRSPATLNNTTPVLRDVTLCLLVQTSTLISKKAKLHFQAKDKEWRLH
jgi:hypothetical protein